MGLFSVNHKHAFQGRYENEKLWYAALAATGALVLLFCICRGEVKRCLRLTEDDKYPPQKPHIFLQTPYIQSFREILVIGDVHGCSVELHQLLAKANATSDGVLKLFVGDLLLKGPNSLAVLRYIKQSPSCLTVRGNNEEKVLHIIHRARNKGIELDLQERWMDDMTPEELHYLEQLPYTISLPLLNILVAHAGLLPGLPMESNTGSVIMNLRYITPDVSCPGGFRPTTFNKVSYPWAVKWNGPQHIFFGHDIRKKVQFYPFATGIDTGCYLGKALTGLFVYGPRSGKFVSQKCLKAYEI